MKMIVVTTPLRQVRTLHASIFSHVEYKYSQEAKTDIFVLTNVHFWPRICPVFLFLTVPYLGSDYLIETICSRIVYAAYSMLPSELYL